MLRNYFQRYTFVRKLHKSIPMVTEVFLTTDQIQDLRFQIRGRRIMEKLVEICEAKNICSRSTTFAAVTAESYDGENALHRLVTNEAVKMLKQDYGVTFPWAELQPTA